MRLPLRVLVLAVAAAVAALTIGCSGAGNSKAAAPTQPAATVSATATSAGAIDYTNPANWLCRPDKAPSPCTKSLDATIKNADGSTTPDPFAAAADPQVDCFYVYPTVSVDPGQNSDMNANAAEDNVVYNQAARFAGACRLYAPLYRQATLTDLRASLAAGHARDPATLDFAYKDVLAAFEEYLAHDNHGRGFVLIGHSQGSEHLIRLIKEQIDPNPQLRSRLVSAIVLGGNLHVPPGADVGGDFKNVPACRKPDQTGCVVAYSTFNVTSPPPALSYFGRGGILCVNPAAPAGGPAQLAGYYPATSTPLGAGATTPFISPRGLVQGECVNKNGASYLEITAAPSVGMPANINGPQWGLHGLDVNVALADLVALVAKQAAAFAAR